MKKLFIEEVNNFMRHGINPHTLDGKKLREIWKKQVQESKIFIFHEDIIINAEKEKDYSIQPLDSLPFDSIWIEARDGKNLMAFIDQNEENKQRIGFFGFFVFELPDSPGFPAIIAYGLSESNPVVNEIYTLQFDPKKLTDNTTKINYHFNVNFINRLFKQNTFKQHVTASPKINIQMRIGREHHKIKHLILISPKKVITDFKNIGNNRPMIWKHSWEVMGHWRKVANIGKNKQSQYIIMGKTWINPSIKGKGPLIKKTRIVKKPI